MHPLTTQALLGTRSQKPKELTVGSEVDTLFADDSGMEAEQELLLRAGTQAVYRLAGKTALTTEQVPEIASDEARDFCSPEMVELIGTISRDLPRTLLVEALETLNKRKLLLSPELLPGILNLSGEDVRLKIALVVGERGLWLSTYNPSWFWVKETVMSAQKQLSENAEIIWQEGSAKERQIVLSQLRRIDPAQAREWLQDGWKGERADTRSRLLATFEEGLSLEDEPFLESCLDDRSAMIKVVAADLLCLLADGAWQQRLLTRGDDLLSYHENKLVISFPEDIDPQWERDGFASEQRPSNVGEKDWLARQVLKRIDPQHWERRFERTPQQLLDLAKASDWRETLLISWTQATVTHSRHSWAFPVWAALRALLQEPGKDRDRAFWEDLIERIVKLIPVDQIEARIFDLKPDTEEWFTLMAYLPRPWSERISGQCLNELDRYLEAAYLRDKDSNAQVDTSSSEKARQLYQWWYGMLPRIGLAVSPSHFGSAQNPYSGPGTHSWQWNQIHRELIQMNRIIDIRRRLPNA